VQQAAVQSKGCVAAECDSAAGLADVSGSAASTAAAAGNIAVSKAAADAPAGAEEEQHRSADVALQKDTGGAAATAVAPGAAAAAGPSYDAQQAAGVVALQDLEEHDQETLLSKQQHAPASSQGVPASRGHFPASGQHFPASSQGQPQEAYTLIGPSGLDAAASVLQVLQQAQQQSSAVQQLLQSSVAIGAADGSKGVTQMPAEQQHQQHQQQQSIDKALHSVADAAAVAGHGTGRRRLAGMMAKLKLEQQAEAQQAKLPLSGSINSAATARS
jgi:hypothetical protein